MRLMAMAGVMLVCCAGCARPDSGSGTEGGTATAVATPPDVHFTARDFAFEGPDTISAGMTTLVLHNDGPTLHHLLLLRLEDGKTLQDLESAVSTMKPTDMPPSWAVPVGGVNPPDPGSDTRATLDIKPGNYAVTCVVDVPDHVPHIMKGMIKGLTVVPATGPSAPAPASDLTVTAVDFSFAFSAPPTAGHHVIKFVNDGQAAPRVGDRPPRRRARRWTTSPSGARRSRATCRASSLGGAAPMAPGIVEYIPVDLTPGNYVALCFVLDPTSHMPHLAEGMVSPFTIS